jgi:hypothetical protein
MPEHPLYRGLKCEIRCNGVALTEYDAPADESPSPMIVVKYIEAQTGTDFNIRYSFKPPFHQHNHIMVVFNIDGKERDDHLRRMNDGDSGGSIGERVYTPSGSTLSRYYFSEIDVAEDSNVLLSPRLAQAFAPIGTIRVIFLWAPSIHVVDSETSTSSRAKSSDLGELPQKSVLSDARSHQTNLRAPENIRTPAAFATPGRTPFAVFEFKYRSLRALRALELVPEEPLEPEDNTVIKQEEGIIIKQEADIVIKQEEGITIKREVRSESPSPESARSGHENGDDTSIKHESSDDAVVGVETRAQKLRRLKGKKRQDEA